MMGETFRRSSTYPEDGESLAGFLQWFYHFEVDSTIIEGREGDTGGLARKLKKNLPVTRLWQGDNGSPLDRVWSVSRCSWLRLVYTCGDQLNRMGKQVMHKTEENCHFQVRKRFQINAVDHHPRNNPCKSHVSGPRT